MTMTKGSGRGGEALVDVVFEGTVIEWRGPAPFVFVAIPDEHVGAVRHAAYEASYGWGCVPVEAAIAGVEFTTSLFPRDGGYLLPLKIAVRRRIEVTIAATLRVEMRIRAGGKGC